MKKIIFLILSLPNFGIPLQGQCFITKVEFQIMETLEKESDIKLAFYNDEEEELKIFLWQGNLEAKASSIFNNLKLPVGGAVKFFWKLIELDPFFNDHYGVTERLHLNTSKREVFYDKKKRWKVIVQVNCP